MQPSSERLPEGSGVPDAGADTGRPAPGPSPAALKPPEASGDMSGARASHCDRLHIPGGRDTPAQLRRITKDVISAGRVESAADHYDADLDASTMALRALAHHAPVSFERRGHCGTRGTDGCGSGRQNDGTDTIADHGSRPVFDQTIGWHGQMKAAGAFNACRVNAHAATCVEI